MNTTFQLNSRGCAGGTLYLATSTTGGASTSGLVIQLDVCGEEALLDLLSAPSTNDGAGSSQFELLDVPCDEVKSGAERVRHGSTASITMWTTTMGALVLAAHPVQEGQPRLHRLAGAAVLALLSSAVTCAEASQADYRTTSAVEFIAIAYLPESWYAANVTADENVDVIDLRTRPSVSPSPSSSASRAPSATPAVSISPSVTPSSSVSPTPSPSGTPSSSPTPSTSATPSISVSPTSSPTPSISLSPSPSSSPSVTASPTVSPTPSVSVTPSSSPTPSISVSPSSSVSPSAPTSSPSPVSAAYTFSFVDTAADDIPSTALMTFFSSFPASTTNYISFAVAGGGNAGQWCAERADWYQTNYITYASSGSTTLTSGSWQKWYRPANGAWSAATTAGYSNYFGTGCAGNAYDWCSEWGLGSFLLAIMPAVTGAGECYASGFSPGSPSWTTTITVAGTRAQACGF